MSASFCKFVLSGFCASVEPPFTRIGNPWLLPSVGVAQENPVSGRLVFKILFAAPDLKSSKDFCCTFSGVILLPPILTAPFILPGP